jgi:hypothetical protein
MSNQDLGCLRRHVRAEPETWMYGHPGASPAAGKRCGPAEGPAAERAHGATGMAVRSTTWRSTKLERTPVTPSIRVILLSSRLW